MLEAGVPEVSYFGGIEPQRSRTTDDCGSAQSSSPGADDGGGWKSLFCFLTDDFVPLSATRVASSDDHFGFPAIA